MSRRQFWTQVVLARSFASHLASGAPVIRLPSRHLATCLYVENSTTRSACSSIPRRPDALLPLTIRGTRSNVAMIHAQTPIIVQWK